MLVIYDNHVEEAALPSAEELIGALGLVPHPEGGHYRETYRSAGSVPSGALPPGYEGSRAISTAILYLLREGECSRLHKLKSDEIWHLGLGGPMKIAMISPAGEARIVTLGREILTGEKLQCVVGAGTWFGARPAPGSGYALVGCTVAPGFDFADFTMGDPDSLKRIFPGLVDLIAQYI
jgi:predicted cupin superfamily sugar epimerase